MYILDLLHVQDVSIFMYIFTMSKLLLRNV